MAATINPRDIYLSSEVTRTNQVTIPPEYTLSYDQLSDVPPINATSNYFTQSSSDPTGGNDGDAHYNTTTNVMWFKIDGTWTRGGTVNASQIITGTLAAARIAANSITADKLNVGTLSAITNDLGDVTTGNIAGIPVSTIISNSDDGYTAYQDTIDFRVPGAPSNSPIIGSITTSAAAVGTVDIKMTWTYTQGAIKADQFILYYDEGITNPTTSSPVLCVVDGDSRDVTICGVPMDKSYKVGIVAARNSAYGIQKTSIVNAWTRTGATPNITANIDGTPPSGVKNSSITLNGSGALIGAGGGQITALDYSNVVNGPPATATSNYFTTSTSNPTGGVNGDAHWNSSSSTMWFKIDGTWRKGGTINAGEITVGTLAAARIAANSITADKINVSTLSAIAANLGTVTAGTISGSANIEITGRGAFKGMGLTEGQNASLVVNPSSSSGGFGLWAGASSSGYSAVLGSGSSAANGVTGTASGSGYGLQAIHTGTGTALRVVGKMSITNTTLVSNLNSDMVDGYHSTSFCRTIGSHGGSATVSSSNFNILSSVSGVSTNGGGSNITIYSVSDKRLKFDISPERLGLDFINKLNPVTFRKKDNPEIKYHGFIAQDMETLIEGDDDCLHYLNPNGYWGVDYMAMTAPLVRAVQQLSAKVEKLERINTSITSS